MSNKLLGILAAVLIGAFIITLVVACVERSADVAAYNQINGAV